ncbi:MAG TPA: hypothetical protein VKB75_18325 [Jatrophihabitans sp.]|nr:hypothetical protein [Jatrophihabitans sp.]
MRSIATVPGLRRVRHRIRTRVSEHPELYLPFARHKYGGLSPRVVDDTTEMVVDGYTRSASTFAVYALQLAQDQPVRLAHHLHAPAQLIEAARRGLPTLLVIREPRGAILSQLIREPGVDMRDAVAAYVRFHRSLRPYRDSMLVGEFEAVTRHFDVVIRRLNARFGLSLHEFVHTPEAVAECMMMIEQRGSLSPQLLGFESGMVSRQVALSAARALADAHTEGELHEAWVPSDSREAAKQRLAEHWTSRRLDGLRAQAYGLYLEFAGDDAVTAAIPASVVGSLT